MKFINYLEKITGIDIYALSSLVIFLLIFVLASAWALKANKKMLEEINNLPLKN